MQATLTLAILIPSGKSHKITMKSFPIFIRESNNHMNDLRLLFLVPVFGPCIVYCLTARERLPAHRELWNMQWYDERVQQQKKKKPTGSTPERWCECMCVLHACTYWKQICNLMCSYYAAIKCFTTMASICNRLNRRVALVPFDVCMLLSRAVIFFARNQLQTKLVGIVMGLCCDVIRTESHFPANIPNIILSLCSTRS